MMTLPAVMDSNKLRHRKKVLLPDPDGPIRQTTSWAAISQLMPFSTSTLPNDLCRSLTEIIAFLQDRTMAQSQSGPRSPAREIAASPGCGQEISRVAFRTNGRSGQAGNR